MEKQIDFELIPDEAVISLTKEELIEFSAASIELFVNECKEMAKANWCESHVEQLEKLFDSVLEEKPYCEDPEEKG